MSRYPNNWSSDNGSFLFMTIEFSRSVDSIVWLLETYDWKGMGFEVVGTAQNGKRAIQVIKEKRPHVVLTDIRMKQITGLMVMEEMQKEDMECLFIVISAYRDFEYAQQACDLGAFAYLLKPIEDDKLQDTTQNAYQTCMKQIKDEEKYESWKKLLVKDTTSFLQVVVQKYVQCLKKL